MRNSKLFWDYFKATGCIGAYLIFREISKNNYNVPWRISNLKRKHKLG